MRVGVVKIALAIATLVCMTSRPSYAEVSDGGVAYDLALGWLQSVVDTEGSWGGISNPSISKREVLKRGKDVVGYNFLVSPKGHILLSADGKLRAYSEESSLEF